MPGALRRAALVLVGLIGLVALLPATASAHQPRPSLVTVSAGPDATLALDAELPLDKLRLAYGVRITDDPAQAVRDQATEIAALVEDRVALTSAEGEWQVVVDDVTPDRVEGRDTARVRLTATPPPGTAPTRAELRWRVITDVVFSHKVYVGGVSADGTERLVGLVTAQQPTLPLTVDQPAARASRSLLGVGFGHFREGLDHQLFLCLVALAAARRRSRAGPTLRRLAALTVVFTLGHSLSLALAASGLVTLPTRWVETGIAVTILLAVVQAVRPVLPARLELAVTGLFGLVHGFGFAGSLADLSLHGRALVVPVLTFNLGLELAQLSALALVVLPLWRLARSSVATAGLAGAIGLVAAGWVVQRVLGRPDAPDPSVASPELLAGLLAVAALLLQLARLAPRRPRAGLTHPVDLHGGREGGDDREDGHRAQDGARRGARPRPVGPQERRERDDQPHREPHQMPT